MIVMSGNWWSPEKVAAPPCTAPATALCTAGGSMFGTRIDVAGLGRSPGAQSIKWTGTLAWPQGRPGGFPFDGGAQVLVEDLGSGARALLDLTAATNPVPASSAGSCDSRKDRWKISGSKTRYLNGSGKLSPPSCPAGSASGLSKLEYKQLWLGDVGFSLQTNKQSLPGPVTGPLRATVVLGPTASAGAAGACAVSNALACRAVGSKLRCE
jgi:hypothetical protein